MAGGGLLLAGAGCGAEDEPDLIAGKKTFAEKCGSCHALKRAGTKGTQGPDLDEAFRQALADGFGRSAIRGVVVDQIENPARLRKDNPVYMPPKIVEGQSARNVAAYVASVAARPGKDSGLLAEAVPQAGSGKPAVAKGGTLEIPATAQLAYTTNAASAKPGALTIESPNPSGTPHNIALGEQVGKVVQDGGVSEIKVTLKA